MFLSVNSDNGQISALKSFDFETLKTFQFQVVATDSGTPSLSSNVTVHVFILDQNDNAPVILYPVSSNGSAEGVEEIPRNVNAGHLVTKVRAYDADIGYNGWLLFSLQEVTAHSLFGLDRYTGQIRTLRSFTETDEAEQKLLILVKDNGNVSLSATATVVVKLVEPREAFAAADVKSASKDDEDNNVTFYLMITLGSVSTLFLISIIVLIAMQCSKSTDYTSKYLQETNYDGTLCHSIQYRSGDKRYMLVGPRMSIGSTIVPGSHANTLVLPDRRGTSTEEVNEGTAVGNIAKDLGLDKSTLKDRKYRIVSSNADPLFHVNQNDGVLYVSRKIDREEVCAQSNAGQPELSSEKTINVVVSDVNDNSPEFSLSPYTFYITEANEAGTSVFSVKALDRDENDNALITYHILRDGSEGNKLTSFLNINSETGDILALKSFDFETLKTFQFQVVATDSGTPSLSSNVRVHVFILDQNDNAPVILYPVSSNSSAEGVEEIPRNVNAGHLVTKVRAYDADIGYNGWLLFSLQEVTAHSLFSLDRYTGQIRTLRSFTETDEAEHKLLILVKDNGNVSLSATATVVVKLVEPREAFAAADVKSASKDDEDNNVTFYLMITLGSVSTLFLISIIVLIAMQCSKSTDYTSKYLQETNYDGTLCHSIQYRSGDKRYMLVGPRMSIGSTIVPGSHANTLVLPDRRGTSTEEVQDGTVVGNIAKDLGLDKGALKDRGYRIVTGSTEPLFQVNQNDGILYVKKRIDREEVCDRTSPCLINLKTVLENPLEIHYVAVEILDINDHTPVFTEKEKRLEIFESALPGARFQLQAARDPDVGQLSIQQYRLSHNEYFRLEVKDRGEDRKVPFLVLQKQLDREKAGKHELRLTAVDGGKPAKSGAIEITVDVLDVNDNSPTLKTFQFQVFATDSGTPSLSSNVTVHVFILDQNDNAPVILYPVSSNGSAEGVEEIPRNVNAGHLVTKVRAYDADIGYNGWLLFSLQEVTAYSLFGLDRYTGQIRTLRSFTETDEAEHKLLILVKDNGNVSLSATATVVVKLVEPREAFAAADVKSATKDDEDNNVTFYLMITLGSVSTLFLISIIVLIAMQCSKSTDYTSKYLQETNYDGTLCHSIQYRSGDKRYMLVGPRMSIGSTIVPGSHANTLVLPDRRGTSTEFQVVATDSGTPSLSSNVTVHVFILDQNDNAPVILYPVSSNGSAEGVEEIPRNVNAGHLVTKVRAYDADIGYNGWLLFSLQEVTAHSLFGLDRYTGQIRTLRSFTETDEAEHKLLILVKDNGNVSLSATATVVVKLVEPREAFAAADVKSATKDDEDNNVTFYLMITLGSVSTLFLISIIVLIAMQCSKSTDYTSKYLQETNYDGTLCHSIQYRSGEKRYMLVGPRMSIGSTIVPGSHANTLVLPDRRGTSTEVRL
ncbi:hypothetical protein NQZ68_008996 [Dissostichus eleginoides]|nr:hypothetical protein NQZ68_008996 [Dissostichus eleginoides]